MSSDSDYVKKKRTLKRTLSTYNNGNKPLKKRVRPRKKLLDDSDYDLDSDGISYDDKMYLKEIKNETNTKIGKRQLRKKININKNKKQYINNYDDSSTDSDSEYQPTMNNNNNNINKKSNKNSKNKKIDEIKKRKNINNENTKCKEIPPKKKQKTMTKEQKIDDKNNILNEIKKDIENIQWQISNICQKLNKMDEKLDNKKVNCNYGIDAAISQLLCVFFSI